MASTGTRLAIVTGAASGIGRATCHRLLADGCRVMAIDLDAERLRELSGPGVEQCPGDVSDPGTRSAIVADVARTGGIDYLVNAAGILRPRALAEVTVDHVRSAMAVNLEAPLFLALGLAPFFRPGGAIVNVSSSAAKLGSTTELAAYAASKAAMISVTRTLAFAWAGSGIRVNAVCPGIIDTPMQAELLHILAVTRASDETRLDAQRLGAVPLARSGEPGEVADVICFLLSPAASFMTAQAINVTGGQVWW